MKTGELLSEIDETTRYLHELLYKAQNEGSWEEIEVSKFTQMADELREEVCKYFELGDYRDPTP
jgi:hypothetical protein